MLVAFHVLSQAPGDYKKRARKNSWLPNLEKAALYRLLSLGFWDSGDPRELNFKLFSKTIWRISLKENAALYLFVPSESKINIQKNTVKAFWRKLKLVLHGSSFGDRASIFCLEHPHVFQLRFPYLQSASRSKWGEQKGENPKSRNELVCYMYYLCETK